MQPVAPDEKEEMMAKLRRITLVDQVVDELGRRIRETWEGGEELPSISELGEQFGVSRAVVRESLKALEAQGMVEVSNGKRAKIARESTRPLLRYFANAMNLDAATNREMIDLWYAMEVDAVAIAAVKRSESDLEALRTIVRRSEADADDPAAFAALDGELHEQILRAAHNRILLDFVHSLRETLSAPPLEEDEDDFRGEHLKLNAKLVNAVSRQDVHAARRAMELHLQTVPHPRSVHSLSALPNRAPVSPG